MDKFKISTTLEKAESRDYDKYPIIIKDNSIEMKTIPAVSISFRYYFIPLSI